MKRHRETSRRINITRMTTQSSGQPNASKKTDRLIIYFVIAILSMLSFAKVLMLITNFKEFRESNAFLTPLPNWILAFFGIILEVVVVCKIIRNRHRSQAVGLWILWFSLLAGFYRAGLYLVSPHSNCHCLGLFNIFFKSGSMRENSVSFTILVVLGVAGVYLYLKEPIKHYLASRLIVLAFVFLPVAAFASDEAVKITGKMSFEYYSKEGKRINSLSSRFELFRNGVGWRIIANQPPSDVFSIASDGKTSFSTISSTNETQKLDSAFVDFGNVPVGSPAASIPWWFYVLSKDIDIKGTGLTSPWLFSRYDPQAFFCTTTILWSDSSPNLISEARLTYSSNLVVNASFSSPVSREFELPQQLTQQSIAEFARKMPSETLPAAICQVISWTNTPFGTFPKEYQILVYSSLSEQERGEGQVVRIRIYGQMIDISSTESVTNMPPLVRPIYVRDFRFRDTSKKIEFVEYGPTQFWATNMEDVDIKNLRNTVKTAKQSSTTALRYTMLVLLLCTSFFPILFFLLRWRRKNRKTNKQKL
jgi:hypothetical protein